MSPKNDAEKRLAEQSAIKSLCRSMMVRSIRDYVSYKDWKHVEDPKSRKRACTLFLEAKDWLFSDVNGTEIDFIELSVEDPLLEDYEIVEVMTQLDQLMRFKTICDILGWNADLVRKRLPTLTKSDLDRIGPNVMDL